MTTFYAERGIDPEAAYARMKGLMDKEGLPYSRRSHTYNSRLAQELGKWADTQPGGYAIHDAFYRAYFVGAQNIGDTEVMIDVVKSVGLDTEAARDVLKERRFKDAVDADWAKSRHLGVTGVPTFVAGGYGVVGAHPYERRAPAVSSALSRTKCWRSWSRRREPAGATSSPPSGIRRWYPRRRSNFHV